MRKSFITLLVAIATIPFVSSCSTTNYSLHEEKMTVAKAQTEIKIGMPSSAVVEILGSPNMVTTDTERRETWVYKNEKNFIINHCYFKYMSSICFLHYFALVIKPL